MSEHRLTIGVCAEHARELRACGGEPGEWFGRLPEVCFWGHAEGSTLGKCEARAVEAIGMSDRALAVFDVKHPKPSEAIDPLRLRFANEEDAKRRRRRAERLERLLCAALQGGAPLATAQMMATTALDQIEREEEGRG